MPTPEWFSKKPMINLRGGQLDDKVILCFLKLLCNQTQNIKCAVVDHIHFSQYLNCSGDTSTIHRHISNTTDLCDSNLVFFPLNLHLHWSLITADFTQYPNVTIFHEDPLNNYNHKKSTHFLVIVKRLIIEQWQWRLQNNRISPSYHHQTYLNSLTVYRVE